MNKKVKKLISFLLVLVLCFAIVGCGTDDDSKDDSSDVTTSKSTDSKTKSEVKEKEIVINFPCIWVGKDSKAKVVSQMINEFNEENKGKIKVVVEEIADYDAYTDKMRTNIAAGTVPDVFTVKHGAQSQLFYQSDLLMSLTKYMDEGWGNQFLQSSLKDVSYNDEIMSVPYEFGVTPVMYNKAMFEQVGINEFPKTYNEFIDACDKLKAAGIVPMSQMTGANAWTSMLWYSQFVISIGGPDVYERGLNDPAFLEAAKVMQKLFEYTTEDAIGANAAISGGHFLNERTAMLINGPWFIGRIKSEGANNMYENVHIAPTPFYEGGQGEPGSYVGFIQAEICAAKQEDPAKEAAVIKFLKHMTDPEKVKELSKDSGALFVIKFEAGDDVEKLQAEMNEQFNAAPYVVPHFNSMVAPAIANEFPQALTGLVLGETTPEEFIETLINAE